MHFNQIAAAGTSDILRDNLLWQKFVEKQAQFEAHETLKINQILLQLPPQSIPAIIGMLRPATKQENAVAFEKHAMGVWFTASRLLQQIKDGVEDIDLSSERGTVDNPNKQKFSAYIAPDELIERRIEISDQFTIHRDGKPFIYKAKYQPLRRFGDTRVPDGATVQDYRNLFHDHNLLLKYQAAIENGMISGACIEIRGLVDLKFMEWACGTNAFERGAIPDVQIIYNMKLPSGAEYRFTLKKAGEISNDMSIDNPKQTYTSEDLDVIRGIESALENPSQRELYEIVSGTNILNASRGVKEVFAANTVGTPQGVRTFDSVTEYSHYKRLVDGLDEARWTRAKSIKPERYNLNADAIFAEKNAGIEDDRERMVMLVDGFQEYLEKNPDIAKTKSNYILGTRGTPEYAAKLNEVVDTFQRNLSLVRVSEIERRYAPEARALAQERTALGWSGPKEGIGLSVDHIMFDSMVEVVAQGPGKKGRSYEYQEGRFMNIDQVMQHLQKEEARSCIQIQLHDPLAMQMNDKRKQNSTYFYDADEARLESVTGQMRIDNIKRALDFLNDGGGVWKAVFNKAGVLYNSRMRAAYGAIKDDVQALQAGIDGKIEDLKDAQKAYAEALRANKTARKKFEHLPKDDPVVVARDQAALDVQNLRKELWGKLESVFDEGQRRRVFARVHARDENIMKFIYAVNHNNQIVFDEESRRHSNFGRASHSELVNGQNCYGAGEMVFIRDKAKERWVLKEINNGSGHYRPPTHSLSFVSQCFAKELQGHYLRQGYTEQATHDSVTHFLEKSRLTDAIARGKLLKREEQAGLPAPSVRVTSLSGASVPGMFKHAVPDRGIVVPRRP